MIIKVQISKTWQEKPFEPFNIQLGVELEGVYGAEHAMMKVIAEELQQTAEEIFAERKARA
jgi:hypothetical protein